MASDLIFYTNPMSRGRVARWMLEEVGEPYETKVLTFNVGMKSPEYLALNPMGKVPTIVHKGTIVTETPAICAYLADIFPSAGLAPAPTNPARGAYFRWLFFAAGPLEAAALNKALGLEVPADKRGLAGFGTLSLTLDALEKAATATPFIAGNRFSAADVYVGSQLAWGMQFGTIEKRPAFVDYAGRMTARPAALKARQLDDALVAAQS